MRNFFWHIIKPTTNFSFWSRTAVAVVAAVTVAVVAAVVVFLMKSNPFLFENNFLSTLKF